MSFFSETVGIDPGSQYLRIIHNNKLIFNEPAHFSIDSVENKISGIGNTTRTTKESIVVSPVNYTISDFIGFEHLIKLALKQGLANRYRSYKSYKVFFSLPTQATEAEKRTYKDSAEHAGAKEVYMIYQNICAALGMNILHEKKDFILIEWGASKFDISVFVKGFPVSVGSVRMGIRTLSNLLLNHLSSNYQVPIINKDIEHILMDLKAISSKNEFRIGTTIISFQSIQPILDAYFTFVNLEIQNTLAAVKTSVDLEKVMSKGVHYTGGGSIFEYMRKQLTFDQEISYTLSQSPLLDTINGLKMVITQPTAYKPYLMI
ncbi:rod shape-determining protein [Xanthocytophaga agilis]|uniref:Rod shape-determining protein n=1 Tax=Xanthocytophaga agilis TaxID=3048010 RepID=A0AAE3QXS8_9BACT|nr:rod shape-determining protein [Xanthocytophaga agilis]MDJ1499430.1 rod shape-determining protein [Xanthocytophaga agilis]